MQSEWKFQSIYRSKTIKIIKYSDLRAAFDFIPGISIHRHSHVMIIRAPIRQANLMKTKQSSYAKIPHVKTRISSKNANVLFWGWNYFLITINNTIVVTNMMIEEKWYLEMKQQTKYLIACYISLPQPPSGKSPLSCPYWTTSIL